MTSYDLGRFTVLLIEDNEYVRNTLADLLRHFGVEQVKTCTNGEEGIKYLKEMRQIHNPGPDIIISDLVMAPINGLLLLRWARTAKDSPNRFVPFVMVSGAADRAYVESSRDLGVTEFLAKPFSAQSVIRQLYEVIGRARQFVATQRYFGPDRRRQKDPKPKGAERRREGEAHVTVVYSAVKTVKAKSASDVWYFRLPNGLKEKAGGAAFTGPVTLPDDILEKAEASLERSALDFTTWALEYLAKLSGLCADAMNDPAKRPRQFAEINGLAHELRGQGGTFGYPLISVFGKMLFQSTMEGCPETDNQVEIVKAHIDAMRAVLREKISGDGGEVGRELLKSLNEGIARYQTVE